ncbi:MAG: Uncharacterised protein [Bacteroidia bacterium]|jgi:hypothetical protein|nr:MAG: Uncharacterised protein [Bacteroidia bacterium]
MKKMMFIGIGVIVVIIILIFTGRKSVHHEITIEAPSQKVWETLINMSEYPNWNPVMKLIDGEVKEGCKVKYQFIQDADNISEIPASVIQIVPKELLNQKGGLPLILTFNHKYILESSGNSTRVTIHEDYRGIGVNFWNPKPVEEAYARLNFALKKRLEEN